MNVQEYFNTPKGAAQKTAVNAYSDYVCDTINEINDRYENLVNETISSTLSNKQIETIIDLDRFRIFILDDDGNVYANRSFNILFNDGINETTMSISWYGGNDKIVLNLGNDTVLKLFSSIVEILNDKKMQALLFDIRKKWMAEYKYNEDEIKKCNAWLSDPSNPFPLGDINLKM